MSDVCEIRVFDQEFNWISVFKTATSIQISRELYSTGKFELHFAPGTKDIKTIAQEGRNRFVLFNGDLHKAGIIRDYVIEQGRGSNANDVIIYGDMLDGLLRQREVVPPTEVQVPGSLGYERIRGNSETVIKHFIRKNLVDCYDSKRNIPYLSIGEDQHRGIDMPWQARFTHLHETVESICEYAEMGYEFIFEPDNRQIIIEVIPGVDRTRGQSIVSPVFFETSYQNIPSYRFADDYQRYRTTGICGGAGEDENRLLYTLGTEYEGIDRWEEFLDCGTTEEINELIYYGQQKLNDFQRVQSLEAELLRRVFIYNKDFFLGDKVTITIDYLELTLDLKVTSVTEVWERSKGYEYEIRFGKDLPNLSTLGKTETEVR